MGYSEQDCLFTFGEWKEHCCSKCDKRERTDLHIRITNLTRGDKTLSIRAFGNSGELGRFHGILWSKPDKDGGQKSLANPAGLSMTLDDAVAEVEREAEL